MQQSKLARTLIMAATAGILISCASNTAANEKDTGASGQVATPPAGDGKVSAQDADWAAILKMEGEAKTIAITTGCDGEAQCRSAPVGSKACGGPRYYIAYCASSTDSAALFQKLEQINSAERTYNEKYQLVSTCEMMIPPAVSLANGACTVQR